MKIIGVNLSNESNERLLKMTLALTQSNTQSKGADEFTLDGTLMGSNILETGFQLVQFNRLHTFPHDTHRMICKMPMSNSKYFS